MLRDDVAFCLSVKVVGDPIGGDKYKPSDKPIDGDGDGLCFEGRVDRKPVPCPPGIGIGSVRVERDGGRRSVWDLPGEKPAITPWRTLTKKHRDRILKKVESLGLTRRAVKARSKKIFAQATPEMRESARTWYPRLSDLLEKFAEEVQEKYGVNLSFETVVGVTASLSSAREFVANVRATRRLVQVWAEDAEFDPSVDNLDEEKAPVLQEIIAAVRKTGRTRLKPSDFSDDQLDTLIYAHPLLAGGPEGTSIVNTTGTPPVRAALAMLRGASVDEQLTGPKRRSFYSNIVDPNGDKVTVDRHQYRAMVNPRTILNTGQWTGTLKQWEAKEKSPQDMFQTSPGGKEVGENLGVYPWFAEIVREIAEQEGLPPSAVQAIMWEVQRTSDGAKLTDWSKVEEAIRLA